jgi:hypothetical protein
LSDEVVVAGDAQRKQPTADQAEEEKQQQEVPIVGEVAEPPTKAEDQQQALFDASEPSAEKADARPDVGRGEPDTVPDEVAAASTTR